MPRRTEGVEGEMNYRKKYKNKNGTIPNGWHIHHIDFNHDNNNTENLIAIPEMIHIIIHQTGFMERKEIESMISIYQKYLKINMNEKS